MGGKRKPVTYVVDPLTGCHLCTSHVPSTHGYPTLWKDGRPQNIHRVLYEEQYGPIGSLVLRHTCDVPRCINMDHCVPGTNADNTNDIRERGRFNPPIGVRSGTAKLSEADIRDIRNSTLPQSSLAMRYGVNQSTISRIRTRLRWKELA